MVRFVVIALGLGALVLGGLGLGAWIAPEPDRPAAAGGDAPAAAAAVAAAVTSSSGAAGFRPSVVARARGRAPVAVFRRPGAARPFRTLAGTTAEGTPLVFLVRAARGAWVHVALPIRPNGATGWVRRTVVTLALNDYRISISLRRHRLAVWRAGRLVGRERIGVGRAVTPTPTGVYYVTKLLRQPNPRGSYGPWAFGISAHSTVLTDFGGGPGEVGIHGTDRPAALGRDVSHGCIRMRNAAIVRLARVLPLGTPVEIAS